MARVKDNDIELIISLLMSIKSLASLRAMAYSGAAVLNESC
jgi:hypothetical protein